MLEDVTLEHTLASEENIETEMLKGEVREIIQKNIKRLPERYRLKGTYGFEDPYTTGIFNLVLIFIAGVMPFAQIDLEPVFEEEAMQVEISTYGSVRIIILIILMLKYVVLEVGQEKIRKEMMEQDQD